MVRQPCSNLPSSKVSSLSCLDHNRSKPQLNTMKQQLVDMQKENTEFDEQRLNKSLQGSNPDWNHWELCNLEDADETALECRRRELQRELEMQVRNERTENRKPGRQRTRSSSTSSTSSTESTSSTSSSSSSSRNRKKRKRKCSSLSSDSENSLQPRKRSTKFTHLRKSTPRKVPNRADSEIASNLRNRSAFAEKKPTVQKKLSSPSGCWSRGRSPISKSYLPKNYFSSETLPAGSKNRRTTPSHDQFLVKEKNRGASPKSTVIKVKKSSIYPKNRPTRLSVPTKNRSSPRLYRISPPRARRYEATCDTRRPLYNEKRHSPRRHTSNCRKRDLEDRSKDDNGGFKKSGKILPLRRNFFVKNSAIKSKDLGCRSSTWKYVGNKSREESRRNRSHIDRDKDEFNTDRNEHDRRTFTGRDSDRGSMRVRVDQYRDRDTERMGLAKQRGTEHQKRGNEASERCEEQTERERADMEKNEKEDERREGHDIKQRDHEGDLPSLLHSKTENPSPICGDPSIGLESSDNLSGQERDRRNIDKISDRGNNQNRDGKDRQGPLQRTQNTPPDRDDRREARRPDENGRSRLMDKDRDARRPRESEVGRLTPDVRPHLDGRNNNRRPWNDNRRPLDPFLDRHGPEPYVQDGRQPSMLRRPMDDQYDYRSGREDNVVDVHDFPVDDRKGRKLMCGYHHDRQNWDLKNQELGYRGTELRNEWNRRGRFHKWAPRFGRKWVDRVPREGVWHHQSRRTSPHEWKDWRQEEHAKSTYPGQSENHMDTLNEDDNDNNPQKLQAPETDHDMVVVKKVDAPQEENFQWENDCPNEGDALSDISDDIDDILNQEQESPNYETTVPPSSTTDSNTAIDIESSQNVIPQIFLSSDEFFFNPKRPLIDCLVERCLDCEISDEELGKDCVNQGIIDVLGEDWFELVQKTRPCPKQVEGPCSARRRWMIDKIVSRLGISEKYAGQEFIATLLATYQKKEAGMESYGGQNVKDNTYVDSKEKVISNVNDNSATSQGNEGMKVEGKLNVGKDKKDDKSSRVKTMKKMTINSTEETNPDVGITLLHPIPGLHSYMRDYQSIRTSIFQPHYPFKRALSARSDLNLRRELCSLNPREPLHFTPPLDDKMYEISVQLFQKGRQPPAAVA